MQRPSLHVYATLLSTKVLRRGGWEHKHYFTALSLTHELQLLHVTKVVKFGSLFFQPSSKFHRVVGTLTLPQPQTEHRSPFELWGKSSFELWGKSSPLCKITKYRICIDIQSTQVCYIIRCYTPYQLHVLATLLGHHQVVLNLQSNCITYKRI